MKDDQIIDLFFRRDEEAITITDRYPMNTLDQFFSGNPRKHEV